MKRASVPPLPKTYTTAPTRVEAVMTKRLVSLSPHNSFEEAVAVMANQPFRHLLVIDPMGRLAGVLSDRDVLRGLIRAPDWNDTAVTELMTRDPVVVGIRTPLSTALRRLLEHRVNCLPVTDGDGRVLGIVTSTDLLKAFLKIQSQIERDRPKRRRNSRAAGPAGKKLRAQRSGR